MRFLLCSEPCLYYQHQSISPPDAAVHRDIHFFKLAHIDTDAYAPFYWTVTQNLKRHIATGYQQKWPWWTGCNTTRTLWWCSVPYIWLQLQSYKRLRCFRWWPDRQRLPSYTGRRCEKLLIVGDQTRNLSLRKRCTNHLHHSTPHDIRVVGLCQPRFLAGCFSFQALASSLHQWEEKSALYKHRFCCQCDACHTAGSMLTSSLCGSNLCEIQAFIHEGSTTTTKQTNKQTNNNNDTHAHNATLHVWQKKKNHHESEWRLFIKMATDWQVSEVGDTCRPAAGPGRRRSVQIEWLSAGTAHLGFPALLSAPHLLSHEIMMNRRHFMISISRNQLTVWFSCRNHERTWLATAATSHITTLSRNQAVDSSISHDYDLCIFMMFFFVQGSTTTLPKNRYTEKFMRLIYSSIMQYRAISSFVSTSTRPVVSARRNSCKLSRLKSMSHDITWLHVGSISRVSRL